MQETNKTCTNQRSIDGWNVQLIPCSILRMLLLLSLIGTVGCGVYSKELEQQPQAGAVVATTIKASLIAAENIDAASIRIRVMDEKVVLDGFAGSKAEADEAKALAIEHADGMNVVSNISVKN